MRRKCWLTNGSTCLILNPLSLGYISALSVHSAGHRLIHYTAGQKHKSLDFVQAAAMPLTYGTAYEALVDRLEIKKGEKSGILIMNGGGGVGSIAGSRSWPGCWVTALSNAISRGGSSSALRV